MALKLTVLSEQRAPLGPRGSIVFGVGGGSIGRANDNDWVLPDPERYLSAHHARVRFRNGAFQLLDTSTNGVFINDRSTALGRRGTHALVDGDRLRIGDYLIAVSIDVANADSTEATLAGAGAPLDSAAPAHSDAAASQALLQTEPNVGDLLQLGPSPTSRIGAVEALLQSVLSTDAPLLALDQSVPQPKPTREPKSTRCERQAAERNSDAADIESFCRGAGIDAAVLRGEAQSRALQLAGSLLREALVGLKGLTLAQREMREHQIGAEREDAQRIGLTGLPVEDLLRQLLLGHEAHQLDAVQWLRDMLASMRRHDAALMRAMHSALAEFLARLDPEAIAQDGTPRAAGANAAASAFRERFRAIANMPAGRLPHLYAEAFARVFAQAFKDDPGS
jgi:type VI secretion system FHA domain protein